MDAIKIIADGIRAERKAKEEEAKAKAARNVKASVEDTVAAVTGNNEPTKQSDDKAEDKSKAEEKASEPEAEKEGE